MKFVFIITLVVYLKGIHILIMAFIDLHQLIFGQTLKALHPLFPLKSNIPKYAEPLPLLEGKFPYAGQLIAPAEGFNLQQRLFALTNVTYKYCYKISFLSNTLNVFNKVMVIYNICHTIACLYHLKLHPCIL